MANAEQLAILNEKGVTEWNNWRAANSDVGVDLRRAVLHGASLHGADLSGANLREAILHGADLSDADLRKADLGMGQFDEVNLSGAHLSGATLSGAHLSGANLFGADLHEAYLSGTLLMGADLSGANLSGAYLHEADFHAANLSGADLSGAIALRAYFHTTNLQSADLSRANLFGAHFIKADLRKSRLCEADLTGVALITTNLEDAILTGAKVYGTSTWDVNLQNTIQTNLIITPPGQPEITVDNLEVAQFIYLLLNRSKLRDVITTLGEKAVLILGGFADRKEFLDAIAARLRNLKYLPIIFDFERPTDRDVTETIKVLAGLSRFVIADITNPRSVPLELMATVPDYMVPFVTILQRGQPAFSMFDDLPRKYHWALPLLEYNDAATLLAALESKVIAPALEKLDEVRRQKAQLPARRSAED